MHSHAGPRLRLRRDGGLCSTGVAFSLWGWERGRMGTYGPQACGPRKKQKWSDESICVHLSFFCRENAHPLTTGGASPRTSHITRPSTHLAYSCPRPAYSAEGVRKKPRARSLSHSPQKKKSIMAAITDEAVAALADLVGSPTTARALLQVRR